ncbi:uncharacterized protein [Apostichopus japonicus]|uniref:uncharacterized protein isoform X2 n=1 Tax=Stichopus japonicus TaxID=307972 RepID=UPI003AB32177
MEATLRELGYGEDVILNFEREGVTIEAVSGLNGSDLDSLGIHGIGRQAILRRSCRLHMNRPSTSRSTAARFHDVTQQTRDKFSPYGGHRKKKAVSLSFTFLCLCDRATMKVPSIFTQRTLTECGLGEKKVLIPSDSLPSEVMDVITRYYPKLREAGGFEYMKADGPSKRLHLIPIPEGGFTAANLKNVAKQAKIYLRPIQCDLELTTTTTTNTDENEVKIKCNNCNAMIPQTKLRSHVRSCRLPGQDARHICDYINIVDPDDGREENDEVLNAVIEESLLEVQDTSDQPSLDARLQESLENFQKAKMLEAPMIVVVRRRKVLRSAIDATKSPDFSFLKEPKVVFSGEEADDLGGPKREFFSLLMQHVPDMGIFEGTSPQLYLTHSINHLNRGLYRVAGQFIAWSLLHGGPGCPVFHPVVYNMMCDAQGTSEEKLKIRDVTDEEVVQNLQMISDSTTQEDMDRVVENVGQWAAGRGCPEIFGAKVADKDNIIQRLLQQHVFYGCKAAIDQLQEGLGSVGGLWDLCKAQSRPYKKLFVAGISSPLTYMGMKKLFTINWVDDVDRRVEKEEEEDTVYCWEQFLRQSERGECSMVIGEDGAAATSVIGLNHVLRFVSGADVVPPTGFHKQLEISFFTPVQGRRNFPTSSTCGLELHLPRGISDLEIFKRDMMEAILGSPGFGKI